MVTGRLARRALAAAGGLVIDRVVGEPPDRVHPVIAFGHVMGFVEQATYRDSTAAGSAYAAGGVALGAIAGLLTRSTTAAVALCAAGRMLRREARTLQRALERGDLDTARARLPALCGRDASDLDESGLTAAVIESVAENTVDAVVGPALWGALLGAPGAFGYRAVNTMDAMVGHRDARYERFGRCAARFDDAANLVPARVTAGLVIAVSPRRASSIRRALGRDAPSHPSPNAGVSEAAFAAALELELGGVVRYGERVERRPQLGDGRRPRPADIARAVRLADRVELACAALLATPALLMVILGRRTAK
jgi:adenosylcobinamide-phosphate synthase